MGLKDRLFRKAAPILAATTLATTPAVNAGDENATADEARPEKNAIEHVVHTTTNTVDKGVRLATQAATYPARVAINGVTTGVQYVAKGIDAVGEHTGQVGKTIANTINTNLLGATGLVANTATNALDLSERVVQGGVGMAGSAMDSLATATRDPKEAGARFVKEEALQATELASDAAATVVGTANTAVSGVETMAIATASNTGTLLSQGVGAINKEAGEKVQKASDATAGALGVATIADTAIRSAAPMPATMGVKFAPYIADGDLRQAGLEKLGDAMSKPSSKQAAAEMQQVQGQTQQVLNNAMQEMSGKDKSAGERVVDGLATVGKGMHQMQGDMLKQAINAPQTMPKVPELNTPTAREGLKDVVNRSEEIRQNPEQRETLLKTLSNLGQKVRAAQKSVPVNTAANNAQAVPEQQTADTSAQSINPAVIQQLQQRGK